MIQTRDQCETGCLLYAEKFKCDEGIIIMHIYICHILQNISDYMWDLYRCEGIVKYIYFSALLS